jgi:hypothetical protein
MMDTVAQRLLESVSWGLKMRLYTGAGLSTMDLLSDVFMIYTYATTGQQGTALSLAAMVGLCLLLQLSLVWVQTRKGPRRVMLKEVLIVLSGMKPGIDAKRVADGNEKMEHAKVNPDIELTTTRCCELVFESIPGTRAQANSCTCYQYALTLSLRRHRAATHGTNQVHARERRRLQKSGARQHHRVRLHNGVRGRDDLVRLRRQPAEET